MAKAFTPEQREELNKQIVELVRLNGRGTVRQLADETGISRCAVSRLSRELAASGDFCLHKHARTGKTPVKNYQE